MKKLNVKSSNGLNLAAGWVPGTLLGLERYKDIMRNWEKHTLLPRNYFILEKRKNKWIFKFFK